MGEVFQLIYPHFGGKIGGKTTILGV